MDFVKVVENIAVEVGFQNVEGEQNNILKVTKDYKMRKVHILGRTVGLVRFLLDGLEI